MYSKFVIGVQLCDLVDCSMPGSSVLHCLPELLKFMFIEFGDAI